MAFLTQWLPHIASAVLLSSVVIPAFASWAKMSLGELVKSSEVIVVGELNVGKTSGDSKYDLGLLRITEAFVGAKGLRELPVVVGDRGPIHSGSIRYKVGQQGLWFLRVQSDSTGRYYLADHPQRFQPETNKEELRRYLAGQKKQ